MQGEIYTNIPEFPLYQVSNFGNIKHIRKDRILKPNIDKDGYSKVVLYKDKTPCYKIVHRIVASCFVANPDNKPLIDHIDNNPANNNASNLRWATHKENAHNRQKNKNCSSKYIGVYFHSGRKKWRARIERDGVDITIGMFNTELEASQARDEYVINNNLLTEYVKLNVNIE